MAGDRGELEDREPKNEPRQTQSQRDDRRGLYADYMDAVDLLPESVPLSPTNRGSSETAGVP